MEVKGLTVYDKMFKEIEIAGKVVGFPTASYLADKFEWEYMTLENSAFENEFCLINDHLGFHTSMSGLRLCEYEVITVVVDDWGEMVEKKRARTLTNDFLTYSHLKELMLDNDITTKEELDKMEEEIYESLYQSNSFPYIELYTYQDSLNCYLEFGGERLNIELSSKTDSCITINDEEYSGKGLNEVIKETITNEIFNLVDLGVQRLENGYVFKNKYYEDLNDVKDVIKEGSDE